MTLEDLFLNEESPLTKEQRKELQNEYFSRISELNEKIRTLQRENNEKTQSIDRMKGQGKAVITKATACVETVKAMLQHTTGSGNTHRMRDFFNNAMIAYIDNIVSDLERTTIDDDYPF